MTAADQSGCEIVIRRVGKERENLLDRGSDVPPPRIEDIPATQHHINADAQRSPRSSFRRGAVKSSSSLNGRNEKKEIKKKKKTKQGGRRIMGGGG